MRKIAAFVLFAAHASAWAAVPLLSNTSFETNNLDAGTLPYAYSPDVTISAPAPGPVIAAPWTFVGGSGLTLMNTAWGLPSTTDGNTAAFLQNLGTISQTFSATDSYVYSFSFDLANRAFSVGGPQTISVLLDGNTLWSGSTSGSNSFTNYATASLALAAGSHTLTFQGTNLNNGVDASVFVDNVNMVVAIPEPESYAMMLGGLGAVLLIARRRNARKA